MKSISTRVDEETVAEIERLAAERGSSVSQVTRDLIRRGMDYDELAADRDRLERQLAATNRRIDEHAELVEYVETERELAQQRRQAPVWRRAKWWVFGRNGDADANA